MVESNYKITDIGLIPTDWEVSELKKLLVFGSGKDYKHLQEGNIPVYGTGGIMTYVNDFLYEGESVGIGRKGTIDKPILLKSKFWTVDTLFFTHSFQNTLPRYIYFQFNRIRWKEYNEASGVPSLNKKTLGSIQIPLPSLSEQEAIIEVLSETESWILEIENLIAKKSNLKEGVMNMLLTPKKDWEIKKLGQIGSIFGGLSGKTKNDFGKGNSFYIPFMNIMKNVIIDTNYLDTVNINSGELQNKVLKNDLLFNGSSETPDELGLSSVVLENIENLYLNSFSFGLRISKNSNVYPLFLSYLMRSNYGRKIIYHLSQGATRYNLSKANFLKLEIAFPKSIKEQIRIANMLSDMNAEIDNLEIKLAKAKLLKQGMMQQLLTGKIRLVNKLQPHKTQNYEH